MEDKKIDNLFQKQLKNLERSPNKRVWNSIETKLKKKKRRVFPFWLFSGSIAAVLVLGFFLFPFSKDEIQIEKINSDEIITTIPKKNTTIKNNIDSIISNKNVTEKIIIAQKNVPFKNQKKTTNSFISEKKKGFVIPKNAVQPLLLSYNKINMIFVANELESVININKLQNNTVAKKLDLNTFPLKKEVSEIKKSTKKSWSVAPVFAVLKSNSFTNTSPINENLASSTKGENSYSYGVQIAYKLNKKWTIQSGVHLQEMSYSNNQIAIYAATQNSTSATNFINGDSFSFNNNFAENLDLSSHSLTSVNSYNGNLTQNYGYIEIPVEVKYNFSNNKKIETQLVTGFSSLFLYRNEVNLSTENLSKTLEVSNLNSINFSGNLGFDFNYLFNKNWSLNLNPMFKVQLNTFSKNANGFAPFNLGVYTGVKYQF
jgi:hypothetical protein